MRIAWIFGVVLATGACGVACGTGAPGEGPLAHAFAESATANGVPRDVLVAIAQTEGSLDMPRARPIDAAQEVAVPVAGPLQLRHGKLDTLARGAALLGVSELALRQDSDLALEAGARVLAEVGRARGAGKDDLATWLAAVEEMSGYADDAHRAEYAHRVFALLARGGTFPGRDGEAITIAPHQELPPSTWMSIDTTVHTETAPADYGPAEWFPTSCTNKCTLGRAGNPVQYVVIHDTEGGWDASVATLQNDPNKSVQYIVGTDGKVGQFIHEVDTAWHAGNFYYNQRSVGIEHVGYANKPYTNAQYAASAKLVTTLTAKYKIPANRAHIIGHDQIPNGNLQPEDSAACSDAPHACETSKMWGGADEHHDPGIWEWCTYMPRIGGSCKCNDATAVLNCSEDHTEAFRCTGGKIELLQCSSCVTQPNGVDDVCNVAPKGAPPPPPSKAPDNQLGPGNQSSGGGPPSGDPGSPGAPSGPSAQGSGCSASGSVQSAHSGQWMGLVFLVPLAAIVTRRVKKRAGGATATLQTPPRAR